MSGMCGAISVAAFGFVDRNGGLARGNHIDTISLLSSFIGETIIAQRIGCRSSAFRIGVFPLENVAHLYVSVHLDILFVLSKGDQKSNHCFCSGDSYRNKSFLRISGFSNSSGNIVSCLAICGRTDRCNPIPIKIQIL
jgi:hypothetical protein